MQKSHTKTIKRPITSEDSKNNYSRIEQMINMLCLNVVKNVFTHTGNEPEGEKLLYYIVKNIDLVLTEPLPKQYTEVSSNSLCNYLLEHFSDNFQDIKINLREDVSRECVYSLFYIWIHNHKLLNKIEIESGNDNSLIILCVTCFQQYKREILDGHTIQILTEEDNDKIASSQKGGNIKIKITIYLFLLLILFTPYAISPEKSDVFEKIKLDQPEKEFQEKLQQTVANQINSVVKVSETHFNDEVKSFLKVVDIAGMAPYELLVKKDTVDRLHKYYDYGGDYTTKKMGFTLKQVFNFLLKLKTKMNKLHDHLFQMKLLKLYKEGNDEVKKKIGYAGAAVFGVQDKKEMVNDIGSVSNNLLKSLIIKMIATISPSVVGPLYTFDKVVLGIDDINDELNKNESSLNWGVSILHIIEKLQKAKNLGTKQMKKIVERITPQKKTLHTFDLSKEDVESVIFMNEKLQPSFMSKANILEDILEEGGPFYGGKKRRNRKSKKAKCRNSLSS